MDFQSSTGTLDGFIGIHHQVNSRCHLPCNIPWHKIKISFRIAVSNIQRIIVISEYTGIWTIPIGWEEISYSFEIGSLVPTDTGTIDDYHLANDRWQVGLKWGQEVHWWIQGVTANNLSAALKLAIRVKSYCNRIPNAKQAGWIDPFLRMDWSIVPCLKYLGIQLNKRLQLENSLNAYLPLPMF